MKLLLLLLSLATSAIADLTLSERELIQQRVASDFPGAQCAVGAALVGVSRVVTVLIDHHLDLAAVLPSMWVASQKTNGV